MGKELSVESDKYKLVKWKRQIDDETVENRLNSAI